MARGVFTRYGLVAAAIAICAAAIAITAFGGALFQPGELALAHSDYQHQCSACHTPKVGAAALSRNCLACHKDIQKQLRDTLSLHARVGASECRVCHTDHRGPGAALTLDAAAFGYDHKTFPLEGAHAAIPCARCHGSLANSQFTHAERTCRACHADDDKHRGTYGDECGACHNAQAWDDVTFSHTFPMQHGVRGRRSECSVCHPDSREWRRYTCYGCHEHSRSGILAEHDDENIRDLENCVRCHPTGNEHERD